MIRLTRHAEEAIEVRRISLDWVTATIDAPDRVEPDPRNPAVTRAYRAVPQASGRVLRVVYRPESADIVVITVHFDRGAER